MDLIHTLKGLKNSRKTGVPYKEFCMGNIVRTIRKKCDQIARMQLEASGFRCLLDAVDPLIPALEDKNQARKAVRNLKFGICRIYIQNM